MVILDIRILVRRWIDYLVVWWPETVGSGPGNGVFRSIGKGNQFLAWDLRHRRWERLLVEPSAKPGELPRSRLNRPVPVAGAGAAVAQDSFHPSHRSLPFGKSSTAFPGTVHGGSSASCPGIPGLQTPAAPSALTPETGCGPANSTTPDSFGRRSGRNREPIPATCRFTVCTMVMFWRSQTLPAGRRVVE